MGTDIQKYADTAMFKAEDSDNTRGPEAFLLAATPDPLGSIAASALMYTGVVVRDKSDITDEQRRHYLVEMQKTVLAMPLEGVHMHFMLEGVTRGFTHQLVRQRTAAYAQESTRFAVKEDLASSVAYPPSLMGVERATWAGEHLSKEQNMLEEWDAAILGIQSAYEKLVNLGMPQEDARGLLPTNLLTRVNYITNLRGLKDHAGVRLCTQAQFEWRLVWASMIQAMASYCSCAEEKVLLRPADEHWQGCDNWQWREIANLFRPVCYYTGKCGFKADFDRKCSIRDRVNAFEENGVPSTKWGPEEKVYVPDGHLGLDDKRLLPISPVEWLADPAAAR